MTEQQPYDSTIARELLLCASLFLQLAESMTKLAMLSDQRNAALRRDMQYNYKTVAEEAQTLFDRLTADIEQLRSAPQLLPPEVERQLAAIEDDLVHIKHMLAGPEDMTDGGAV